MRAPHLHDTLRRFCLGAFAVFTRELEDVDDSELRDVLEAAHTQMRTALDGPRPLRRVYRRPGRACPRCGGVVRSKPQGAHARTAYWCPGCQPER